MSGSWRFAVLLSVVLGAVGCYATTGELEELRQWSSDTASSTEPRPTVDDADTLETVAPTDGPPHTGDRPTQDTAETIDSGWPTEDTAFSCESCPVNSGYPCPCDAGGCADDAICFVFSENATMGICLRPCEEDADCLRPDDCQAEGQCLLMGPDDQMYCAYVCEQHSDCPANLSCDHSLGVGLCGGDSSP